MCVFFAEISTAQHHNVVLQCSLSHTHTHTHTHMTGQQGMPGQVVPDFSGLIKNILTQKEGRKNFLADRGSRISEKDFQTCKCFQLFMYVFFLTRALCRTGFR